MFEFPNDNSAHEGLTGPGGIYTRHINIMGQHLLIYWLLT